MTTSSADKTFARALIDVQKHTVIVRKLEGELEAARSERNRAMLTAADAGVSGYRIAKEADTSAASVSRIIQAQK